MSRHTDVAIIWAGFAGISAYLKLRKRLWKDVDIKIFDMRENFTYTSWLHITVGNYNYLKRLQFSYKEYYWEDFIYGEVTKVDKGHAFHTVQWDDRTYDYVIICTGSRTNYFWNSSFEKNAYTLRNPEDICPLNRAMEAADIISVIGWWFTGVEVASMAAIRFPQKKVRLIHSGGRILNDMSERTSLLATSRLLKHNVQLILNEKVIQVCETNITLNSWTKLVSDATILVSGIKRNDELHDEELTFTDAYKSLECEHILVCWDASSFGLYTTAHNAMIEWRRMGELVADKVMGISKVYKPLKNWPYLALALGPYDGLFTTPKSCIRISRLVGLFKWFIEQRVLIEFKYKIMLPV